jgi:UDP-N-acetyl-D-mannosaminuronate dehydrogenase
MLPKKCKNYLKTDGFKHSGYRSGYVGLPLARLFATKHSVIGFDINEVRVAELKTMMRHSKSIRFRLSKVLVEKQVPQLDCIALLF